MINPLFGQEMSLGLLFFYVIILIWEMIWKGIGMWHSAQGKQRNWFIAILVFSTFGLLPIIYLIWFKPERSKKTKY